MNKNYNVILTDEVLIGYVRDILPYLSTQCDISDANVKQLYVDIKGNYYEDDLIKVSLSIMGDFELTNLEVR